ncbi:uncharacterized protein LOC135388311 [Ornithodoros turicata]|uniref:uncharacterized protein LOC135388311 n=1 Tax=Ornithodoros turicata TaxID=34597 RepID=UPI003138C23D
MPKENWYEYYIRNRTSRSEKLRRREEKLEGKHSTLKMMMFAVPIVLLVAVPVFTHYALTTDARSNRPKNRDVETTLTVDTVTSATAKDNDTEYDPVTRPFNSSRSGRNLRMKKTAVQQQLRMRDPLCTPDFPMNQTDNASLRTRPRIARRRLYPITDGATSVEDAKEKTGTEYTTWRPVTRRRNKEDVPESTAETDEVQSTATESSEFVTLEEESTVVTTTELPQTKDNFTGTRDRRQGTSSDEFEDEEFVRRKPQRRTTRRKRATTPTTEANVHFYGEDDVKHDHFHHW